MQSKRLEKALDCRFVNLDLKPRLDVVGEFLKRIGAPVRRLQAGRCEPADLINNR
jgi:hypothetical protein